MLLIDNLTQILIAAPLAVGMVWATLRGLDMLNKRKFSNAYTKLLEDPRALAHYHGLRFLGVCLLIGLVVLKGV